VVRVEKGRGVLGIARKLIRRIVRYIDLSRRAGSLDDKLSVFYGDFIAKNVVPTGGKVKFFRLAEYLPHTPAGFNLVYLGSNTLPGYWQDLVSVARRFGIPIVLNQNGVYSEGWYGPGWGERNGAMRELNHSADFVIYQSEFCKRSAELYLGMREGPSAVIHNPVDTGRFLPRSVRWQPQRLRLLLSGSQYQDFPVRSGLETLREVGRLGIDAELLIAGALTWAGSEADSQAQLREWCTKFDLVERVKLLGCYSQDDAPALHHEADILLQTKYNDSCPSAVVEALSCGLPVVYSASGGTPELVGEGAGVGVPVEQRWDTMIAPCPKLMAEAVAKVSRRLEEYAEAARRSAVERFEVRDWVRKHLRIFEALMKEARGLGEIS
jgi:glycosyltransferase involved in cell wall biosynthesis